MCTNAQFLPLRDGHGNHYAIIIDITYRSLIVKETLVVELPQSCFLQFFVPSSAKAYNHILTKRLKEYHFYKKGVRNVL